MVSSTAIEARVREDCGGGRTGVRAENGRGKRYGAELYRLGNA